MSLIGPRPDPLDDMDIYTEHQKRKLEVRAYKKNLSLSRILSHFDFAKGIKKYLSHRKYSFFISNVQYKKIYLYYENKFTNNKTTCFVFRTNGDKCSCIMGC